MSKCQCGERELVECPGEWEPGCDLGSNAAFAATASPEISAKVNEALGLWVHTCPMEGKIWTGKGEPCSWCGATE